MPRYTQTNPKSRAALTFLEFFALNSTDLTANFFLTAEDPIVLPSIILTIIFGKDKVKKLLAERRVVLRIESRIHEHTRKLQTIEVELEDENVKIKAAIDELKRLRTVKEASTALKVWQPEIIHTRQKQIVENCSVPVDFRINALEMEIKLCKQHISGFLKIWEEENKRLEAAKEQLSKVKFHPLQSFDVEDESRKGRRISGKKLKRVKRD
ncbi:hypothetical protein R6Q57_012014 [Mikania cordata]